MSVAVPNVIECRLEVPSAVARKTPESGRMQEVLCGQQKNFRPLRSIRVVLQSLKLGMHQSQTEQQGFDFAAMGRSLALFTDGE